MADISSSNQKTLGRCICLITDASKGLGRAIAHEASGLVKPGSVLLVAHSQALLLELKEELRSSGTPQLTVRCVAVDLSTADGVNEAVKAARQEAIADLEHDLTAGLLKVFPCRPGLQWSVVNISSLFAVQALPNSVLYGTAKTAGKMMFSVLAAEEPNVKVLSYSPGPMDTEMQDIHRLTGIKRHLIPCKEPAAKLMKLLLDDDFTSGMNLDFLTA